MPEPRLIETTDLPISDIKVEQRLRPVGEAGVETLIASIGQLGRIKDDIHIRRIKRSGKLRLIAGGHRLEAATRLGWETIRAKVWDCTDTWAQLMEIDDNLAQAELDPLELCTFLAARKRVYEDMHPETRKGHAGATGRWDATDMMSFASSTAQKRNLTERHIRRLVAIGERLGPDEKARLRAAPKPVTLNDLQALSKVGDAATRYRIVDDIAYGRVTSVAKAIKAASGHVKPPLEPAEIALRKMLDAFDRAPKRARRTFVRERADELRELLADLEADA